MTYTIWVNKKREIVGEIEDDQDAAVLAQVLASRWHQLCEAGGFYLVLDGGNGISHIAAVGYPA